ncbi:hypothetical protein LDENG_00275350 [Lucifuga dentata]|nr:hypothetical protein LDENG_00275350 [Lucifuga dentata]
MGTSRNIPHSTCWPSNWGIPSPDRPSVSVAEEGQRHLREQQEGKDSETSASPTHSCLTSLRRQLQDDPLHSFTVNTLQTLQL